MTLDNNVNKNKVDILELFRVYAEIWNRKK